MPPDDRRAELAAASLEYVLTAGLSGLSLRPLAAAIGTSDRMLVYHFGTKDALVEAVLELATARLLDAVAGRVGPARSPAAVVRQYWRAFIAAEVEPYLRLRLETSVLAARAGPPTGAARRVARPWVALARQQLVQAGVPAARAPRVATALLDALDGLVLDLLATGQRSRVEGAVRELAAMANEAATRLPDY